MKKYSFFLASLCFLASVPLFAQQGAAINTSGAAPAPSAMLDVSATDKGMLVPRLTTAQRTAIVTPATGLLVYDNTTNGFWYYDGTAWRNLSISGITFSNQIKDTDGNTKVTTEQNPNEDIIRFHLAGNERMRLLQNSNGDPRLELLGGSYNLIMGTNAGKTNVGTANTFVGVEAGKQNTTGINNTYFGTLAGANGVTDTNVVAIGTSAGYNNTANNNTFVGAGTGYQNTTGQSNTYVGTSAGTSGTTASNVVAIGVNAGYYNQANDNTFVGTGSGNANTTGYSNTYLGVSSGAKNLAGFDNTFLGVNTGYSNTSGNSNVYIGTASGFSSTTASRNTLIGSNSNADNLVGSDNLIMGYDAGRGNKSSFNVVLGAGAGFGMTTGESNTIVGFVAGRNNGSGVRNTMIGVGAGFFNTAIDNTFVGALAGYYNTTGTGNSFFGRGAGEANTTGLDNTFLGMGTGFKNTTGYHNTFIGRDAGVNNTEGYKNTFIGERAGLYNTIGFNNIFLGNGAGLSNVSGSYNTFVGLVAGFFNNGERNTYVGQNAGKGASNTSIGGANSFFGTDCGISITTGNRNSFFGETCGATNTTGEQNAFFGHVAGQNNQTGSSNVFLGHSAGLTEMGSNRLYIANAQTTPSQTLIYGEFDNSRVQINTKLGVGRLPVTNALEVNGNFASKTLAGSWAANCDARLKRNIQPLNPEESLAKILSMRGVSFEWNDTKTAYTRPTGQQIGFIAQDVQKVFPQNVQADTEGYLQTAYAEYDPIFVEAIRALDNKNKALIQENQKLKDDLNASKSLIEKMDMKQQEFEKRLLLLEKNLRQ